MKRLNSVITALAVASFLAFPAMAHDSDTHDDDTADLNINTGVMNPGMGSGPCGNVRADIDRDLNVKDITEMLQLRLDHWGNDRIKLGKVVRQDEDTIIAEIVTQDGSLVDKLAIDRDTGSQRRIK